MRRAATFPGHGAQISFALVVSWIITSKERQRMENNDKRLRIEKLRASQSIIATGNEYEGLYELNNKTAEAYILNHLRGRYVNCDTGDIISITRKGAEKVTRHDAESLPHLKSMALIPNLIRHAIFIDEEANEKDKNSYDSFRYFVVGLNMDSEDYVVKLVIGVKNGYTYYDHALTKTEKTKLLRSIDEIKRPFASKEIDNDGGQASTLFSECKDKRLISILQINWDFFRRNLSFTQE